MKRNKTPHFEQNFRFKQSTVINYQITTQNRIRLSDFFIRLKDSEVKIFVSKAGRNQGEANGQLPIHLEVCPLKFL